MEDYFWETQTPHCNNMHTMSDYLHNHLPSEFEIVLIDGTYAEVVRMYDNARFAVYASGNGDFTHHKVRFELLKP